MDYHAHIPAGIALAGAVAWVAGLPVDVAFIIGGAIGGALPDIDISSADSGGNGAAIEHLGEKSAEKLSKITPIIGKITGGFGKAFDVLVAKPLAKFWRFLSKHFFGAIYYKIYHIGQNTPKKDLGKRLKWVSSPKPWAHRGGITHSLTSLFTFSLLLYPISLIVGGHWFYLGALIGIISHLLTDACCRTGTMFFWPWGPSLGFNGKGDEKSGHGIRIVPFALQVNTNASKKMIADAPTAKEKLIAEHEYRVKRAWTLVLQALAVICVVGAISGIGTSSGVVSFCGRTFAIGTNPVVKSAISFVSPHSSSNKESSSSNSNASVTGVNPEESEVKTVDVGTTVAEQSGPTSLTYGDLPIEQLPKGIMKLPDESLWVIGVGPVTAENLNTPQWSFTQDEKNRLLAASTAQRINQMPSDVSSLLSGAANTASNAAGTAGNSTDAISGIIQGLTGGGGFGFHNLTPYTQS